MIKLNETPTAIGVLTNPAFDNINIFFKNVPGDYTIDLFSTTGTKVKTEKTSAAAGTYTFKMMAKGLALEVYYLKIYNHQTKKNNNNQYSNVKVIFVRRLFNEYPLSIKTFKDEQTNTSCSAFSWLNYLQ